MQDIQRTAPFTVYLLLFVNYLLAMATPPPSSPTSPRDWVAIVISSLLVRALLGTMGNSKLSLADGQVVFFLTFSPRLAIDSKRGNNLNVLLNENLLAQSMVWYTFTYIGLPHFSVLGSVDLGWYRKPYWRSYMRRCLSGCLTIFWSEEGTQNVRKWGKWDGNWLLVMYPLSCQ